MNHALPTGLGFSDYDFIVRIDPAYANGMIILDSARQWNSDYGADWFQRVMVGLGAMLGLQRANDLPVTNLMAFDSSEPFVNSAGDSFGNVYFSNRSDRSDSVGNSGFVNFSADGFDSAPTSLFGSRPSEPIFPGNADILHGQYIHRPDSNDIDLYRFTIDLGDQQLDEKKKGLLTAESFAERLPNSSELDTVLSLYREVEILRRQRANRRLRAGADFPQRQLLQFRFVRQPGIGQRHVLPGRDGRRQHGFRSGDRGHGIRRHHARGL